jgi:hypothetical protein
MIFKNRFETQSSYIMAGNLSLNALEGSEITALITGLHIMVFSQS